MLTIGDWFWIALGTISCFIVGYFITTDTATAIIWGVGGLIGGLIRAYVARRSWRK